MAGSISIGDEAGFVAQQALGGINRLPSMNDVTSANGQISDHRKAVLKQKAVEFEGVFLAEMLKPMWKEVDKNNMFGGGEAEQTYRSMLIDEYGKAIANHGGIGLADRVYQDLLKAAEMNKGIIK